MAYGSLELDEISTSGNLAVTGNVASTGFVQPSALLGTAVLTPPVFQDSAGTPIGTLCRAWVNFNGTGTIAIRAAFNVSSITDGGVGVYTANFTNAMPDTNYVVVAASHAVGSVSNRNINIFSSSFQTTDTGRLSNIEAGAVTDTDVMCVSVFR
jgi:hypothetical protein